MLTYIFSSLTVIGKKTGCCHKAVSNSELNKQITIFAALTTANLVVMKIEQKDQALRIRKLEKEIEELKRPEGE
mgnify:CR=1 FL=1